MHEAYVIIMHLSFSLCLSLSIHEVHKRDYCSTCEIRHYRVNHIVLTGRQEVQK